MADSLVTDEMRRDKGVWSAETVSFPVDASDIRRWAIAVYWPEIPPRIFWDEDYARTTKWKGIVAPEEFNPFAWPIEDKTGRESSGVRPGAPNTAGSRGMNGGTRSTSFGRIRPGDVIRSRKRLSHWEEVETRLGPTAFIYNESEWHNQRNELVRRVIQTTIKY